VYGQSFVVRNGLADKIKLHNDGTGSFSRHVDIGGNLEVGGTSSFTGAMQVDDTLEIADTSSFGGDMTIDANAFVYGQSFAMYDGTAENVYIHNDGNASFAEAITAKNINCNETLDVFNSFRMVNGSTSNVTINNLGQSSFAGKMQIQDELVVEGHSSFFGSVEVASGTASFGGPVVVNTTSSFTGVANFEDDISMTGESFKMFDGTTENIYIRNDGNASFAEAITASNINCDHTLDVFNSFRMVDGSTSNVTINNLGQSSFAGEMQINNTLDVDNTLTIGTDTVTIDPSATEEVVIQGGIYIRTGTKPVNLNAFITQDGTGFFKAGLSTNGGLTAKGDLNIKNTDDVVKATISVSDGNASFAGTMQVDSTITTGSNASFGGTLQASGVLTTGSNASFGGTLQASGVLTTGSNASFGGTLQASGETTLGDSLIGTSGSFSSTLKASDFIIPSDRRFKTEISHIPNALEKVKQISGCTYMINDKPSVGVIAQEVLKILPETVHTGDDGYYAVSYHGLIGLLIEAVKELSEKVK